MKTPVKDSHPLPSIDLDLLRKLQDPDYRERFFLAEASAEIARQLIALRKRRQLSQAELAERANTHQPAVSRAEQADYQNWSFNTLRKLTNAMGGRLAVKIEAWEDVLAEYFPEINDQSPSSSQPPHLDTRSTNQQPRVRASAGRAGKPPQGIIDLSQEDLGGFNPPTNEASLWGEYSAIFRDQQGHPQ